SLLIGLIWGPWHAPLTLFAGHNYPSTPVFGVFMMTVFCMLSSPILSFITVKSRSIFPAAFFHVVMNGSASLGIMIVAVGTQEVLLCFIALAGFIALAAMNLIIFICTLMRIIPNYKLLFQQL